MIIAQLFMAKALDIGKQQLVNIASSFAGSDEEKEIIRQQTTEVCDDILIAAAIFGISRSVKAPPNFNLHIENIFRSTPNEFAFLDAELAETEHRIKLPVEDPHLDVPTSVSLKTEKSPGQRNIGNTGRYEELKAGTGKGGFLDNKEAHHIVPQRYLIKHGVDKADGLSVMLPKKMHKETNTHGPKAKKFDLEQSYRDATAKGVKDLIRVEKIRNISKWRPERFDRKIKTA